MTAILYNKQAGIASIILNRPDKFNSFNGPMAMQMQDALTDAATDKNIRCIFISANGKAFCAGQDLSEAIAPTGPGIENIVKKHYNPIVKLLRKTEKPIVCAVNGVAAGAGANIALACDVVVAAQSASFIQAFSKIGLIPDSGGTFTLPRLVGFQRASALMMLGDKVTAADALQMGMLYAVYADEMLQEKAMQLAQTLSQMPTLGIGLTKRLLNMSDNNLQQQLDAEAQMQVIAAQSHDYGEGVNAFLEKRKPVFKGE
ncbi:MAG: enoyl-CoA hydratase/isomerase family protein [Bacteroidia bacterium]|nr:enoyl-CoA hydratase/isomerase family protein [Bacteroidia bacterium]HQV00704.1 enoyl-CoA hydratase-related protein [Bacteroidia bacterium]